MSKRLVSALISLALVAGSLAWFVRSRETTRQAAPTNDSNGPVERANGAVREPHEDSIANAAPPFEDTLLEDSPLESSARSFAPGEAHPRLPADVLEVTVLDEHGPVTNARVEAVVRDMGGFPAPGETDAEVLVSFTADDGRARLAGIEPATYAIRATTPTALEATLTVSLWHDEPDHRLTMRFGSARVFGIVYDKDGRPLSGSRIWCRNSPDEGGSDAVRETFSDVDGSYSIPGLCAGFTLVVETSHAVIDGIDQRRARWSLVASEPKRIDFGSPRPYQRWRGALRLSSGARAPLRARILWQDAISGVYGFVDAAPNGSFETELAPGRYEIRMSNGSFDDPRFDDLVLDAHEVERDIALSGACLRGSLEYVGKSRLGDIAASTKVLLTELATHRQSEAVIRSGREWAFPQLAPGSYRLKTFPQELVGSPAEGLAVELDGSRALVALELEITDARK